MRLCGRWGEQWWAGELQGAQLDGLKPIFSKIPAPDPTGTLKFLGS